MKTGHPAPHAPDPPTGATDPGESVPAGAARLGWLDALRGLAALVVALHHACYHYLPQFRHLILQWVDPGKVGVLVFFLVSGYIIPASLERTGSVRRFWIGRLFRIYPLLLAVLAATLLLAASGLTPLREGLRAADPLAAVMAHLTMMQDLLAVTSALNVLWTLSYEMAFYLLVVALFLSGRLDRHSATLTTALAVAALTVGTFLPRAWLSSRLGITPVAVGAAAAMALAIFLACSGRPGPRRAGALLGGALAAALVLFNGRVEVWEGLVLMAVMFAGTAIYRAEHGQIRVRAAAVAVVAVLGAAVTGGLWHITVWAPGQSEELLKRSWVLGLAATALAFAAGMALRHRRVPRWLARLGLISYSVYLVHPVLLMVSDLTVGRPRTDAPLLFVPYLLALLLVSLATHRFVEEPLRRYGRRLAHHADPVPVAPGGPAAAERSDGARSDGARDGAALDGGGRERVEPGSPEGDRAVQVTR
ncbi:acyltransferase family protein [Actinomadura viridis]|uniref:acyltransferase family protein n=1 Tax=Actinomadura viridis TaxID=58110 RepID=UPI00367572E0